MSTAAQIVTNALRRLAVVNATDSPAAADVAYGVTVLGSILSSYASDAIDVSGDIPLPAKFEHGITALLAAQLASPFGISPATLGPASAIGTIAHDANEGMAELRAAYVRPPTQSFEIALQATPSRLGFAVMIPSPWAQGSAYALSDQVTNAGNLYSCTTAGTSSAISTGPSGTLTAITDGTVVWAFLDTIN